MRHVLTFSAAVLAASLSLASAQVRSQSIVVSPLPVAAPAAHLPASLADLVRRGGSITLTDAQGRTVATVSPDGTVKLTSGMTLASATAVSVKQGNATTTYLLAARVDSSGQLLVTRKNADGRTQVVPLVAALRGATDDRDGQQGEDGKKADGKKDGQQGQNGQDGEGNQGGQHGNSGEHGNAGHPGQPGRGSGHR